MKTFKELNRQGKMLIAGYIIFVVLICFLAEFFSGAWQDG